MLLGHAVITHITFKEEKIFLIHQEQTSVQHFQTNLKYFQKYSKKIKVIFKKIYSKIFMRWIYKLFLPMMLILEICHLLFVLLLWTPSFILPFPTA